MHGLTELRELKHWFFLFVFTITVLYCSTLDEDLVHGLSGTGLHSRK